MAVVGARSEFVKCAPVMRVLADVHDAELVHTGAAFEYGTSPEFFADLELQPPRHNLGIVGRSSAGTTRAMLQKLAPLIAEAAPDWVLVFGSSNATLAGALVAAKLGVRVAHVEAGLRSYRRRTPDELNHIVVDHVSTLHFCPVEHAVEALASEGLESGVHNVGDVLLDRVRRGFERAREAISEDNVFSSVGLDTQAAFAFATIHHAENTEDSGRLTELIDAFSRLDLPVVLPLHPRTQDSLTERPDVISRIGANIHIVDPLRPFETLLVVSRAQVVLTDSGGLQREAFFLGVPCVTLRDDTEWVDTLNLAANTVVGASADDIVRAVADARAQPRPSPSASSAFGDGRAAEKIVDILQSALGK